MPDSHTNCNCNLDHHKERVAILETNLNSLKAACEAQDMALRREIIAAGGSEDRARETALKALEHRLDSMNEWSATFRDMREAYVERKLWETEHKALESDIHTIIARISSVERELASTSGAATEHKSIQVKTIMIMGVAITVINVIIDLILRSTRIITQ